MLGIFTSDLAILIVTAALLFSILAYNRENNKAVFFWFGVGFTGLMTLGILLNIKFYYESVAIYIDPQAMMVVFGCVISIVFLILSQSNQKSNDDKVTDAFLDEVINSEDEVWDPES